MNSFYSIIFTEKNPRHKVEKNKIKTNYISGDNYKIRSINY